MKANRWLLAAGVASALNTANAYRPLARRKLGGALAFSAGWLTSELPVLTIAGQAVGAGWLARRGALRRPTGRAGLAVAVGSWVALANLQRRSSRTAALFDEALRAGLGEGYRSEIPDMFRDDVPLTLAERHLPGVGKRGLYRATRRLSYGMFARRNRLDIWRSADLPLDGRAPVLVQIHGGGWVIGDEHVQGELLLGEMARRGWVGVAITYRLSPKATWPDHIVDVKRAIAWVRAHIAEYGGDPRFIAVTGGSAGGHLSALAALTPNDPEFQPGFESADTTVQAAVPWYGVYDVGDLDGSGHTEIADLWSRLVVKRGLADDRRVRELASPITRVGPNAPPFLIIHGANDTLVPVEHGRRFSAALAKVSSAEVIYVEVPGAQHAFEVPRSTRGLQAVQAVARFLDVIHHRWRSQHDSDAVD